MATQPQPGNLVRASDAFGFTTFTPSTTGLTAGTGAISEGWYQTLGQMVLWGIRIELGTSPSFSASVVFNLPITAYTGGGAGLAATLGTWNFRSGGTINYAGSVIVQDSGGLTGRFSGAWNGTAPSSNVGLSTSTPATPAATNVLSATGIYRAA